MASRIDEYLAKRRAADKKDPPNFDYSRVENKVIRPEILATLPESEQRAIRAWEARARKGRDDWDSQKTKTASVQDLALLDELRKQGMPGMAAIKGVVSRAGKMLTRKPAVAIKGVSAPATQAARQVNPAVRAKAERLFNTRGPSGFIDPVKNPLGTAKYACLEGLLDELEKVSASRWREMLRLGRISAEGVKRLESAKLRRGGGALLDRAREVRGIDKGTEELARKMGVGIEMVSGKKALRRGIAAVRAPTEKNVDALKAQLAGHVVARQGGGAAAVPIVDKVFVQQSGGAAARGLAKKDLPHLQAILKRHEIDEMRAARRAGADGKMFVVGRRPRTLIERASVRATDAQRAGVEALGRRFERSGSRVGQAAMAGASKALPPRGKILAGRHMSPFPVLQEGQHYPMISPAVKKHMRQFRQGEMETLPYEYGSAVTKSDARRIEKAFKGGWLD